MKKLKVATLSNVATFNYLWASLIKYGGILKLVYKE
jgi:hypothetical protein